jgi:hypothetical protein
MKSKFSRIVSILLSVLLVLAILLGAVAIVMPRLSFPRTDGNVHLAMSMLKIASTRWTSGALPAQVT